MNIISVYYCNKNNENYYNTAINGFKITNSIYNIAECFLNNYTFVGIIPTTIDSKDSLIQENGNFESNVLIEMHKTFDFFQLQNIGVEFMELMLKLGLGLKNSICTGDIIKINDTIIFCDNYDWEIIKNCKDWKKTKINYYDI